MKSASIAPHAMHFTSVHLQQLSALQVPGAPEAITPTVKQEDLLQQYTPGLPFPDHAYAHACVI
jgi:hypothetical protein